MKKLRQLLPRGEKLRNQEVIDQTISLIVSLEQKLLEKISRQGKVPSVLSNTGLQENNLSLDKLREAMALIMPARRPSPFII